MKEKEFNEYLEKLKPLGSIMGLDSMNKLCKQLGNPQDDLKFVHIAGTNGKGSTLAMVSSVLIENGYRVGCYISPSVMEYKERFQINHKIISKSKLLYYMEICKNACDELVAAGNAHPTQFEIETALSFLYFRDRNCDIVILETGMGGETDATNVVNTTLVAAFTSISLDHIGMLGDTVTKIAEVKAGIIKPNCKVVSIWQDKDVVSVLKERAKLEKVPIKLIEEKEIQLVRATSQGLQLKNEQLGKFSLSLCGAYQKANAALAIEIIKQLQDLSYPCKTNKIISAFSKVVWPARFEYIQKKPLFMIDGAHNRAGAKALSETLSLHFKDKKFIFIIGVFKDKDLQGIIEEMHVHAKAIVTVKTPIKERAMEAVDIAYVIRPYCANVTAADSIEEAVELTSLMAGGEDAIVAFGSLSFLGDLKQLVQNKKWTRSDSHGKSRED